MSAFTDGYVSTSARFQDLDEDVRMLRARVATEKLRKEKEGEWEPVDLPMPPVVMEDLGWLAWI